MCLTLRTQRINTPPYANHNPVTIPCSGDVVTYGTVRMSGDEVKIEEGKAKEGAEKKAPTVNKNNPWLKVFGDPKDAVFRNVAVRVDQEPMTLNDGSTHHRLASFVLPLTVKGAYLQGGFIVRREKQKKSVIRVQWPGSGGKFKTPNINTDESDHVRNALEEYGNVLTSCWYLWRRGQVAEGNVTSDMLPAGMDLTADELKDLGL